MNRLLRELRNSDLLGGSRQTGMIPMASRRQMADIRQLGVGKEDAIIINYLPQMLKELAMKLAGKVRLQLLCFRRREKALRVAAEAIRKARSDRERELQQIFTGSVNPIPDHFVQFNDMIDADLTRAWFTFRNEVLRQLPPQEKPDLATAASLTAMLIAVIERLEGEFDTLIAERSGSLVKHRMDMQMRAVALACAAVLEYYGANLRITELMQRAVNVLLVKCYELGRQLLSGNGLPGTDIEIRTFSGLRVTDENR